jgi:hypothetical protein
MEIQIVLSAEMTALMKDPVSTKGIEAEAQLQCATYIGHIINVTC